MQSIKPVKRGFAAMEIKLDKNIEIKLLQISRMSGFAPEKIICDMVEEKIKDYCREDGAFHPVEAEYFITNAKGVKQSQGRCFVLRHQKVWEFNCCQIFHDGKLKLVNEQQLVFGK